MIWSLGWVGCFGWEKVETAVSSGGDDGVYGLSIFLYSITPRALTQPQKMANTKINGNSIVQVKFVGPEIYSSQCKLKIRHRGRYMSALAINFSDIFLTLSI